MFSLLVTLISIALVAALALASLYYGGPVFNQGAARAHAAKISAQGQQIQGAAELYKADTGEYPLSLAELVAQDYLKSVPVAAAQEQILINNALAATSWVMVAPKTPVFALTGVTEAVCKAINLASYGVEGILKTARESNRVQCYGTDLSNLMIVQAKAPSDLVAASSNPAAVIQVGTVLAAPVPAADSTDTSNAGWLVAPGSDTPVVTPPAVPQMTFSTSSVDITTLTFADTTVGATAAKSLKVTNTGTADILLNEPAFSAPAPYTLGNTTCNGATLAPGASCTVTVRFSPIAAQVYTGGSYAVTVATSASSVALPLSATGLASPYPTSTVEGAFYLSTTLPDTPHPGITASTVDWASGIVNFRLVNGYDAPVSYVPKLTHCGASTGTCQYPVQDPNWTWTTLIDDCNGTAPANGVCNLTLIYDVNALQTYSENNYSSAIGRYVVPSLAFSTNAVYLQEKPAFMGGGYFSNSVEAFLNFAPKCGQTVKEFESCIP